MEWRAGFWILPWIGSIALVSYLGPYGGQAAHTLAPGVGAALMLVVSVAIYLLAYRSRLPAERVRELIGDSSSGPATAG
jgi:hypothetical protein